MAPFEERLVAPRHHALAGALGHARHLNRRLDYDAHHNGGYDGHHNLAEGALPMPMIDVYAAAGTFADTHQLAVDLAATVMRIEQVPDIPLFRQNTAAFVHELPASSLANVDGDSRYVRGQVLTHAGALDRDKHLAGDAPL